MRINMEENEMKNVSEVTDGVFDSEVLESEIPVLVDFWAPWCAPCKMISPVIEDVADSMAGKMKFVKLNTDENPTTAQKYQIMAIPSLVVFKNGKELDRIVGFKPKDQLIEQLSGYL
jgi:thioredoxin 1